MPQVDASFQLGLGVIGEVVQDVKLGVQLGLDKDHPALPPPRPEQEVGTLEGRTLSQPALVYCAALKRRLPWGHDDGS